MILSFHPCFEGDLNILCAGRQPGVEDLNAIKRARAVVLPQGCQPALYEMARQHCPHVFPNYQARFKYPGKIGQIELFKQLNQHHPRTFTFTNLDRFYADNPDFRQTNSLELPFVAKFDWGGEGLNVYLIQSDADFESFLEIAAKYEKTGQSGFLIQEYIDSANRALRVVIVGRRMITYWRVQSNSDSFASNVSQGARIDRDVSPDLQRQGAHAVNQMCRQAGINLAGFDLLFNRSQSELPYFLEINYFFGRQGVGGSEAFYRILEEEIREWIRGLNN